MAGIRPSYEEFSDLPAGLRDFLLSDQFDAGIDALQASFKLQKEQRALISDKLMDAAFGDFLLPKAVEDIKAALVPAFVSEEKWKELLAELLKQTAWPLREMYGEELESIIRENQINIAGWPPNRILFKPLTYSGAASEIANQAGFSLMGGKLRERLRDLVISRIKGIRIDEQIRETLLRNADFGGLGLDTATADKTMAAMAQILDSVRIMSEDEYGDWLSEETRKKNDATASTEAKTEDDLEIEKIQANMPKPAPGPATLLDKAVDEIYGTVSNRSLDEYLARRLRYIVSSRLRDVRSQLELVQLLQRDTKVGGMGMARDEADALARNIEDGYNKFHDSIMGEEKAKLEVQMQEQKVKIDERKRRDAEEHAKWYKDKIQVRQQQEVDQKAMAERFKLSYGAVTPPAEVHPIDQKEKVIEKQRFGEMVPATDAGAATLKSTEPVVTSKPSEPPKAPVPMPSSVPAGGVQAARPEVKISKASAVLQQGQPSRPRMEDIKMASPRLSGPLQEMKTLTLSEFRRLAKDPEVASQKIIQRLDIMGQESFEKRLEGIKAWQGSPLQQTYMQLVAESFRAGKPVVQLAEDKRKAGENVPSPEELAAIITLNSKLHF